MGVNTTYKDTVFSLLFSDPVLLRELYEAIAGVILPRDIIVTINTLEGALYRTLQNDISFVLGQRLIVLLEHQSTINPNMAVRLLLYIARIYEKLTAGKNLYGRKLLRIPRPEFIVLYNGVEPYPDEGVLNLSDAFEDAAALGVPIGRPADLELKVKVYNINQGRNEGMLRRCGKLHEYSAFVAKARECETGIAGGRKPLNLTGEEKEEAMREAVNWCVGHNILKTFLESHGSEVVNMLMSEWKLEDALVVEREEGIEEGIERNKATVARTALAEGMSLEIIHKLTGLDIETIEHLSMSN